MTCDKVTYDTYGEAMNAVHAVSSRDRQNMKAYKCKECAGYHLASEGKRKRIKNIYGDGWGAVKIKNKNPRSVPKAPPKEVPASTYKLLNKEQAANLKRLIDGNNQMEIQKVL